MWEGTVAPCNSNVIILYALLFKLVGVKCLLHLLSRKDVGRSPADVAVTGGESSLHVRTPRGELSVTLPAGVAFEPGSCVPTPSGESGGEELHFRMRISASQINGKDDVQGGSRMETHPDM